MSKRIRDLIGGGESQRVEFKSSLKLSKGIGESIVAFANADGGVILIGVSDHGKGVGISLGRNTIEEFVNWIKRSTDPQIYPDVQVHQIEGKQILEVLVKENEEKPVFFKDRVFQRVGKTNQRISASKIRELAKQERKKIFWDSREVEGAGLQDIDEILVKWFLKEIEQTRRLEIDRDIPFKEALERLDLIRGEKITNAAILLFGKLPQRFFPQAEVRCGRFKGTKPLSFIDMKVFEGSIINQREDAVAFVKQHIELQAEIVGKERVETWEYPIEAIREAITNAICHRKYDTTSNVQVRMFDDRIEVWGCGSLPTPITVEDLKKAHKSVLRNSLIGKCFFLIKFIEQWGTGTNRIVDSCVSHGLPEPLFEEMSGGLVVTLRKYRVTEELMKELEEQEKAIVNHIMDKGRITRQECEKLLQVSTMSAFRYLKALEDKKIIVRKGSGKNIHYVLV